MWADITRAPLDTFSATLNGYSNANIGFIVDCWRLESYKAPIPSFLANTRGAFVLFDPTVWKFKVVANTWWSNCNFTLRLIGMQERKRCHIVPTLPKSHAII